MFAFQILKKIINPTRTGEVLAKIQASGKISLDGVTTTWWMMKFEAKGLEKATPALLQTLLPQSLA